jgi:hypothetical protein
MGRRVKGTLFVDYVRMLRARKGKDWSRYLRPDDLPYLSQRIQPDDWYPMETFERMGLAILDAIKPGLELVRAWGYAQMDWLYETQPDLVAAGDVRETLTRFQKHRAAFFDFDAQDIIEISHSSATVCVSYGMDPRAEEAATHQTMGFLQRLIELSGAKNVTAQLSETSWSGSSHTLVRLQWSNP